MNPNDYPGIENLWSSTKISLLLKSGTGLLGSMLCSLNFSWDENIPTACTDGINLKWNPKFYMKLNKTTRITILAHELYHCLLLHCTRGLDLSDQDRFGWACDYAVNLLLMKDGFDMSGFNYLIDYKYEGWTCEQIYKDLISSGDIPMLSGGIGSDVIRQTDVAKINQATSKVLTAVTTAKMTGAKPGSIPGEIEMLIDKFLNPKLPWETILFNYMNGLVDMTRSYARPNRRYDDILMPGQVGMEGLQNLNFYMDSSCSVTDEQIIRMNSEMKHIWETFSPEQMLVVIFDTAIRKEITFTSGVEYDHVEIVGRGGTDAYPCWDHAKRTKPDAIVMFSDMEFHYPPDPGIPVIWICLDRPNTQPPSYGKLIHVEG